MVVSVFDSLKGYGPQIRPMGFFCRRACRHTCIQTLPTLETSEYYIYFSNDYEI